MYIDGVKIEVNGTSLIENGDTVKMLQDIKRITIKTV